MLEWLEDHPKVKLAGQTAGILAGLGMVIGVGSSILNYIDEQARYREDQSKQVAELQYSLRSIHDLVATNEQRQVGWEIREARDAEDLERKEAEQRSELAAIRSELAAQSTQLATADAERAEQFAQRENRFEELELGQAQTNKHISDARAEMNRLLGEHLGAHQN